MMNVSIAPGKYIVAVSGGIDSVVLLDLLAKEEGLDLVVAHFDHGIRDDSAEDATFTESLAKKYDMQVEVGRAELGKDASEELARDTRYHFLQIVKQKYQAEAIITAHHQDDFVETAIINIIRGTGRLGLSSIASRPGMVRPLLSYPKQELLNYSKTNDLVWREDSTNSDKKYLRNQIRLDFIPKMTASQRQDFLTMCQKILELNKQIDPMMDELLTRKSYRRAGEVYSRFWFNSLPHDFATHVVHYWLHRGGVQSYSHKTIDTLALQLKATRPGKKLNVGKNQYIELTKRSIRLSL